MNDDLELLWKFYTDSIDQARLHERQRINITNIVLVLSSLMIGLVTSDQRINASDLSLSLMVILIGMFGVMFNYKQYHLFNIYYERSRSFRNEIALKQPSLNLLKLIESSDSKTNSNFRIINNIKLHKLWTSLSVLVLLIGIILTSLSFFS